NGSARAGDGRRRWRSVIRWIGRFPVRKAIPMESVSCGSRVTRWRGGRPRRRDRGGAPHAGPYEGMHYVYSDSGRPWEALPCGHCWQRQCERWIPAAEQPEVPGDCRCFRAHVPSAEIAPVRCVSGVAWLVLRDEGEACARKALRAELL